MPDVYYQTPADFPQISANRTRTQACAELAEFVGGEDKPAVLVRAGRSWDAAVREFNSVGWRFNRVSTDITLTSDVKTYSLPADFRTPLRAHALDSNDVEKYQLCWIPYKQWLEVFSSQTQGASAPNYYTAMNTHNAGLVRYEPYPSGASLQYPQVRHVYLRRIVVASGPDDRLNVPVEVDEAIFQLALAYFLTKQRGFDNSAQMFILAKNLRMACEAEHRDWTEETGWGANG